MTLWLVRAGKHGDQEQGAYNNKVVTIGWNELPDLSNIKSEEQLEDLYSKIHPEEKKMAAANRMGQIWNFISNIKKGDLVALPLKSQAAIVIGEIIGDYEYKEYTHNIKHTRRVEWLRTIPRSEFDQDLLFSLGAFMTVCKIQRNNAEERVRKLLKSEGKFVERIKQELTNVEPEIPKDIEQFARDQIVKYLEAKFSGHKLAALVDGTLRAQGYVTKVSSPGADGGVDILAGSGPLGFDDPKICVQVKSSKSPVEVSVLRQLEGVARNFKAEYGILVAWGGLTKVADQEVGRSFFATRIWDQGTLLEQILKYYEKFDDELKAELPLKRIWAIVEEED